MKTKWITSILFFYILVGCTKSQSKMEFFIKLNNEKLSKSLAVFNDSLLTFFPTELDTTDCIDGLSVNSSYKDNPQEVKYISIYKEYNEKDKVRLKEFIRQSEIYEFSDPCLFFIRRDYNVYGFNRNRNGRDKCKKFVPIPYPDLFGTDEFPDDTEFYIYQAVPGLFYDYKPSYLRYYLPEEWKNGLSRGFAISEKKNKILYWVVIW